MGVDRFSKEAQPKDGEYEWTTVRYRKRRHLRTQSQDVEGRLPENKYHRRNWRDALDITSFYFTRFPEEVTQAELWNHFRQWGEVKEIFLPKRRNKEGRRYGFVRLKGVEDKRRVERDLDNSFIRGLKLHVNIPKYGRGKTAKEPTIIKRVHKEVAMADNIRMEEASRRAAGNKPTHRTYAEVLSSPINRGNHSNRAANHCPSNRRSCSSLTLDIFDDDKLRYENVWVGRLKKLEIFERLEEEMAWHLGPGVLAKYLGDDMTLLLGLSDTRAAAIIRDETEQGSSLFYSMVKWNPQLRTDNRLVWLRCWGIPIVAWKMENFRKLVAPVGDLVDVDDDIEHMQRLDRARILIRTPWPPLIQHEVAVHIEGENHRVFMVEENGGAESIGDRYVRSDWGSSDEILSDEADTATFQSWSNVALPMPGAGAPAVEGEHVADCHDTPLALLPTGHANLDGPVGNDRTDNEPASTFSSNSKTSPKRKDFESAKGQISAYPVGFDENAVDRGEKCDKVSETSNQLTTPLIQASAILPVESVADPMVGHIMDSNYDQTDPHTPHYIYSQPHTMQHLGPCPLTTPEAQVKVYDKHKEQQQELQVYSRRRGCKKKIAQQDGPTDESNAVPQRENEDSTDKQCELIYQMGLTLQGDIKQIKGLMEDMEKRDNMLATEMGENIFNHDNTII
ncbi:hypothetical protein HKD37_11G032053 [Glycine soja]